MLEVIDQDSRLREFAPEWIRFTTVCPPATPFQTPEWLLAWWRHFGSGKPHVLVFREAGDVAGIVPCFLHTWNGRRQLTLIGSGLSDYLDPLLLPRYEKAIVEQLGFHLSEFPEWEICDWQDLSAETPLAALGQLADDTPCSRIVIEGAFESFLAARPKDLRRNLRRYAEKAREEGELRFSVEHGADRESLDTLIRLHRERWGRAGEAGVIDANRAGGFLHEVAGALARKDMLRFFTVYFKRRTVAILMALRVPGTIFSYVSAFDPDYAAFGFGRELLAQAICYAFREGCQFWNFLRGDEGYKFSWGAVSIPKRRLLLKQSQPFRKEPDGCNPVIVAGCEVCNLTK